MTQTYNNVWSQPCTIPIPVSDILAERNAVFNDIVDATVNIHFYPKGVLKWNFTLSLNPSSFILDEDDDLINLYMDTSDFVGKIYSEYEFKCSIGLVLNGDNLTTYEPKYDQLAYDIRLIFTPNYVDNLS